MNSGQGKMIRPGGSQTWIRFGFSGCPDIMGQLTDGRYLAIECKRPGGRVRPEQRQHISIAADHGAVALIARSIEDVQEALGAALSAPRPAPYTQPYPDPSGAPVAPSDAINAYAGDQVTHADA
jgi:hypothetical protein